MSSLTLPQMNGSHKSQPLFNWLEASVHDFFSTMNWDDHPPEIHASVTGLAENTKEPPSLEMSVSRFFATIEWGGHAIANSTPVAPPQPIAQQEFTLDDFSGLF
jgi:hypothetical protein